jgi:hypothetical protein
MKKHGRIPVNHLLFCFMALSQIVAAFIVVDMQRPRGKVKNRDRF